MPGEREIDEATEGEGLAYEAAMNRVIQELCGLCGVDGWHGTPLWAAIEQMAATRATLERAELLASGTPLWVATDEGGGESTVSQRHPDAAGEGGDTLYVRPALTPPGTVRRYALVPIEEEGRDG